MIKETYPGIKEALEMKIEEISKSRTSSMHEYYRLRKIGKCVMCYKPVGDKRHSRCPKCLKKKRDYDKKRRGKK